MIEYFATLLIPLVIAITIIYGLIKKLDVLKLFTDGVVVGLKTVYKIFPYILAVMIAITFIKETGAMSFAIRPLKPILEFFKLPEAIIPLAIFRPISGGGATSVAMDIFKSYGPDSTEGKIASIIMGGTETTFYVTTILLSAAKLTKKRGILIAALLADAIAIAMAIILVNTKMI